MKNKQLSELIDMNSPQGVMEEVEAILSIMPHQPGSAPVRKAFDTIVRLFNGGYPGYRSCNTNFHDLRHATDTFLAMARLLHGASLQQNRLTKRHTQIGLIASLFHDTGYIQEVYDTEGTGAKHTENHVQRSMDFISRLGDEQHLSADEVEMVRSMILCTDLSVDVRSVRFLSPETEFMGCMLVTADLLAQVADRMYLEKLSYLYDEFQEGNVGEFSSQLDLLKKTMDFFTFTSDYLADIFPEGEGFLESHFVNRWKINHNLYQQSIENHRQYLKQIIRLPGELPLSRLKRER